MKNLKNVPVEAIWALIGHVFRTGMIPPIDSTTISAPNPFSNGWTPGIESGIGNIFPRDHGFPLSEINHKQIAV